MLKTAKPVGFRRGPQLGGGARLLPDALPALPVVAFQPFDPGVALLRGARVAIGAELLRNFGEDVSVVRVSPDAPLHLSGGDVKEFHADPCLEV